jgi:hypothetical protein
MNKRFLFLLGLIGSFLWTLLLTIVIAINGSKALVGQPHRSTWNEIQKGISVSVTIDIILVIMIVMFVTCFVFFIVTVRQEKSNDS